MQLAIDLRSNSLVTVTFVERGRDFQGDAVRSEHLTLEFCADVFTVISVGSTDKPVFGRNAGCPTRLRRPPAPAADEGTIVKRPASRLAHSVTEVCMNPAFHIVTSLNSWHWA